MDNSFTESNVGLRPAPVERDRSRIPEAMDDLERELTSLAETLSVFENRLDGILRPDQTADKRMTPGTNASPDNSRQQNMLWSAVQSARETHLRLQTIMNRIDL